MVVEPGEKDPTGLQGLTRKMALQVKMTQTITTTQQFINLSTQKNLFFIFNMQIFITRTDFFKPYITSLL